ncbi:polysaccharide deacetylase family protein [Haloechinothrix salitolerans]|uniref:Polysaccharide deacetylase family protein n=1 Tax=Haloechinothrix salitolerans TaxID=926830 RepID=A0ABW2C5F6_9PSEU
MPWKNRYTVSDERCFADEQVTWPGVKKAAFTLTIDLSPTCRAEGLRLHDFQTPEAFYGMNRGMDVLRQTLGKHAVRATFAVPGVMAEAYAPLLRSLESEGHEVAAHGWVHEDPSLLDENEEEARLARTTDSLGQALGHRPWGWFSLPRPSDKYAGGGLSDQTVALLVKHGYEYLGNSTVDDRPHYWLTDAQKSAGILSMPYYYHFDDQFFLLFPARGTGLEHMDALERNWRRELRAQQNRGLVFNATVHPHAIAWPHRLWRFDTLLADVMRDGTWWNPTARECTAHWRTLQPLEDVSISEEIWTHYEDSLN